LRSLERQDINRGAFEVIVVKNFEDPASDKIIERNRWRNILFNTRRWGEQVAIGVEEASGDVIAFLDDDEFEPNKLFSIREVFAYNRSVSYFHDTRKYIIRMAC
jgi:glycosyltransferase involved in cell wall biosynthesis